MRELVRLAPPGGVVLDPFLGSGSTAVAAVAEGRRVVGFDLSNHNVELAEARCASEVRGLPFVPQDAPQSSLFAEARS